MKISAERSLFTNLVVLTAIIVFAQLALVSANVLIASNGQVFQNALLKDIFTSGLVLLPLLAWLICQFVIYAGFITVIWVMAVMCGELFKLKKITVQCVGILLWCLAVTFVWLANNILYPHSVFFSEALHGKYSLLVLNAIGLCGLALLIFTMVQLIKVILHKSMRVHHKLLTGFLIVFLLAQMTYRFQPTPQAWRGATMAHPNIIIIGLDAVRTDFVNQNLTTTHINDILNNSVNFTNAYTMIAQTLPSWVTVLTSSGPKVNLARENLANMQKVYIADTLPKRLQGLGYETMFATDDGRFAVINKNFGFDKLITPRGGVAEFILGEFNDFPLSNLLVRSKLGKWLFPYNYANHESLVTYDPKNFMELMRQQLNLSCDKPLFLAVHFNVSGWPFGWYNSMVNSDGAWYYRYTESIREADGQLADFLTMLGQHNLLKNTILVLMSDHGVTLGLPEDRAITEKLFQGDKTKLDAMDKTIYLTGFGFPTKKTLATSYGYGGDLLSPQQLHVLLAFKGYDIDFPIAQKNVLSSLADIAPTLLDFLHQPHLAKQEGKSLLPVIEDQPADFAARDLYFETSSISFLGGPMEPPLNESLTMVLNNYDFDRVHNAIYISPQAERELLSNKQRAVLAGNWLLAELPGVHRTRYQKQPFKMTHLQDPSYMVLLEVNTGKWTTDLQSAFAALAPVNQLCAKLQGYYGSELQCVECSRQALALKQKSDTTSNAPHDVNNQTKS